MDSPTSIPEFKQDSRPLSSRQPRRDAFVSRRQPSAARVFLGESEMARLMSAMGWTRTPLGRVETWSPSLRMMVPFLLANRFPLLLLLGS